MKTLLTLITVAVIVVFAPHEKQQYSVEVVIGDRHDEVEINEKPQNNQFKTSETSKRINDTSNDPTGLIRQIFGDEWQLAYAIARAESGLDCSKRSYQMNTNGTYDHGLFQINDIHYSRYPEADFYDCETNVQVAKNIRDAWGGWHAWSAYNSGSYLQFLK